MFEKAVLVKIRGKVTGVGFRLSAEYFASQLHSVKGYIKNNSYSEVEAFIQGDREEVEEFLNYLRKGPPGSNVTEFIIADVPASSQYDSFIIKT
jgi:acylphosphatase